MSKRTNGEGTIFQMKNGLWRAEITLGYEGGGKRVTKKKSSKDLTAVQKRLNDERAKLQRGIVVKNSDYTLGEWLAFWLESYKRHEIKPQTLDLYEDMLNTYALPKFGAIKLSKVRGEMIQLLFNDMHKKGLATSTIKNLKAPLSQAFDQAVKNELIYANPCKTTVMPKKEPRESRAFTADEQIAFLDALNNSTFARFFEFDFNTGMRCGEIIALTWSDIDFNAGFISVNKTAYSVKDRDENATKKTKTTLDTTKTTKGTRQIPMNKRAFEILTEQRGNPQNKVFVFASSVGTTLQYRNIRRAFDDFIKRAGLSDVLTIHSIRHSFATRLLERGANVKVVSDLLGHASIQITLDTYAHAFPNMKKEAISLLD